jgi:hypothetical protein
MPKMLTQFNMWFSVNTLSPPWQNFLVPSCIDICFDFVIITLNKKWRHVISKFNLPVQSSLLSKKQLLNSRHSAAVVSQQPVGYELSAAIVSKAGRLHTCATDSRAKE